MSGLTEVDKIMVRIYADLVEKGKRTLESVPEKLKNYVVEELEKRGRIAVENIPPLSPIAN